MILEALLIQLGYRNGCFLLLESDAIERLKEASASETLKGCFTARILLDVLVVEADFGDVSQF